MQIEERLRKLSYDLGADLFGVADLAPAREAIEAQGGPELTRYPRAISLGIILLDTIVDQLPKRSDRAVSVAYRHHAYDVVNDQLDIITLRLSRELEHEGYRAYPLSSSQRVNDEKICAAFSHKMAAHLAGLGWIGKSCLLVTPEAGPRVRFATILTDAPLEATGEPMEQRCGECQECVKICPVSAFTGRAFTEDEPREARYDALKCQEYLKDIEKKTGRAVCGMCLYVCPHGRKHKVSGSKVV